jgi:hypothetical protein
MADPFTDEAPELGHGLDEDSAEIAAAEADEGDTFVCGPGDGDATVMSWARAM